MNKITVLWSRVPPKEKVHALMKGLEKTEFKPNFVKLGLAMGKATSTVHDGWRKLLKDYDVTCVVHLKPRNGFLCDCGKEAFTEFKGVFLCEDCYYEGRPNNVVRKK